MAEILNKFFSSVFVHDDVHCGNHFDDFYLKDELDSFIITLNMINGILLKLNENKAPGDDGLHSFVLKKKCNEIVVPLYIIFDNSLNTGSKPNYWKLAIS